MRIGSTSAELLAASKRKWDLFFERYGFLGIDLEHDANKAFATVIGVESMYGRHVDHPVARQMFILGYLKGMNK